MKTPTHTLTELFKQLGLESSASAIEKFVRQHRPLAPGVELQDAAYWSPAQRHFIQESWHADSDWAELIDQLDTMLRA